MISWERNIGGEIVIFWTGWNITKDGIHGPKDYASYSKNPIWDLNPITNSSRNNPSICLLIFFSCKFAQNSQKIVLF